MDAAFLGGRRDVERVRPLLARLSPPLAGAALEGITDSASGGLSETLLVGKTHILKLAWTPTLAKGLWRQRAMLEVLNRVGLTTPLPKVIAASDDPVALLYERLPGKQLTWGACSALDGTQRKALAADWAEMVIRLHHPSVLASVENAGIALQGPLDVEPAEAVESIRRALLPRAGQPWLASLLDEVERTLAPRAPRVLLHADLGGHNVLVSGCPLRVGGLIDVEQVCRSLSSRMRHSRVEISEQPPRS